MILARFLSVTVEILAPIMRLKFTFAPLEIFFDAETYPNHHSTLIIETFACWANEVCKGPRLGGDHGEFGWERSSSGN